MLECGYSSGFLIWTYQYITSTSIMSLLLALLPKASADFADYVDTAAKTAKNAFKSPPPPVTAATSKMGLLEALRTFWTRHSPSEFIYEGIAIAAIILYVIFFFIGRASNEKIAKDKFALLHRQLHDQFALVGMVQGAAPLMKENDEEFSSYVSGRLNVEYANMKITLLPRQDLSVGYCTRSIYGMYFDQDSLEDRLTIKFVLPPQFDGFVFGLVNKSVMRYQRIDKWDLQFTKTNDASFGNSFVVMSEIAEITDKVLTKELSLVAQDMQDSLEYVVISDQPIRQPKGEMVKDRRVLRLSVLLNKASANEQNLNTLLAVILSIIDDLPKIGKFSANAVKKLQLSREEAYKAIAKAVAEEEAVDAPKRLTRKEIRDKEAKERLSGLSAKAQKKAMEKERERMLKKGQKSMTKKA